jgi:hypothetical protein
MGICVAKVDHDLVGTVSVQLIDRVPQARPTRRWKDPVDLA